ncbi:NAD(P) transhydrogenase subunit alpha [Alphaproteobacteria bacterium]|nr:NAD(P) transhydrogenase subunit alpha [Alphaproteobacteria bacterium]
MIVGVLKEPEGEARVALTPSVIKKLAESPLRLEFRVESQAGAAAGYTDDQFSAAGALVESRKLLLERAQILPCVRMPDEAALHALRPHTVLLGQLNPLKNNAALKSLARLGVSAFALEWLPRITRAQSMDILSSQNNLAGYQAVILAAATLGRAFPLMMTAAGSVPAAHVLVVGAGVMGLQVLATAKRLGAVVSAFDVRVAAKEQVESLGATFISVESPETGEGQGGYAKAMSASYQILQEEKLLSVLPKQDVVITTAQIQNKSAPQILTKKLVRALKDGALILDLSIESGGNCELSQPDREVVFENKRILAPSCLVNQLAATASPLFASNIAAFIKTLFRFEKDAVAFDLQDDLIQSTLLTYEGRLVHPLCK